jgi:hypothetical protein
MADYTQPDVVNKRVRFFDGQFLQDQDFIDEQKYHLDRERRQSRQLRVTGVTEGLMVTTGGAYQVTVAKGMAVDALGRHLVLATELALRLTDKFAKQQGIELYLIYQESPTDVAETGGRGARRWDESPKIAALAPDGTVAVAPDGVSSIWDGPTVLLARLAVADKGAVTIDSTAARRAGLSVSGNVGIGTTNPGSDLEVGNFDARNRYLTLKVAGGNQYRSGVKLWAWQENYGYSVEYDERGATGNGLHVRTHDRNADGTTRLFVGWNGNVGIGTTVPPWKLSVSSSKDHLALYREPTETVGGTQVLLELAQIDSAPARVPDMFPSIRFHHHNRFWHRIEAQSSGFHLKTGDPSKDDYSDIKVNNVFATGQLYFHPSANWGFEDKFGPHTRRYWYIARPNWNQNDFSDGAPTLKASGTVFPSDVRLKDDTTEITAALEKIGHIRGVSFAWNEQGLRHLTDDIQSMVSAGPEASAAEHQLVWDALREQCYAKLARRNIGLIAQEVEQVVPELVYTNDAGYKCVDYSKLTALLVQAVKEQQTAIEKLRARLGAVERATA